MMYPMKHPTYSNGDLVLIGDIVNTGTVHWITDIAWIFDLNEPQLVPTDPKNLVLIERAADAPQP